MKYTLLLAACAATLLMAQEEAVHTLNDGTKVTVTSASAAQTTQTTAPAAPTAAPAVAPANVPVTTTVICEHAAPQCDCNHETAQEDKTAATEPEETTLSPEHDIRISVVGQGVAPVTTASPAQAYALAKRAAVADAYRLIAEKVKGVRVEGQDVIKNMMVQRSTVRTYVDAMVRQATIIETTFKEGLCEVEMEIVLSYSQFAQ